jgi:DNA repair protein RecN (Recombination protein N)
VIESLRIENLAVVERVELRLGRGLNVVTGETGAGKSLLLGALDLLAGGRASTEAIRSGADEARVEAVLRLEGAPELEAGLRARGFAVEDGEVVVSRSLARSGRSRARVAGEAVPISTLAELLGGCIEIASQHESQALRRPEVHGRLLDAFAGLDELRAQVAEGVRALRELDGELDALRRAAEERARREDFLAFEVREIEAARLEPGELDRLAAERGRLVHAERLAAETGAAAGLLAGDPTRDGAGAADLLAEAARRVEGLAGLDASLAPLAERLRSLQAEAADVADETARYAASVEGDPARLAEVEERLRLLERLSRKYGPAEADIVAFLEEARGELARLGGADAQVAKLEAERRERAERLGADAEALSAGRRAAGRRLAAAAAEAASELAMPGARFEVALEPVTPPAGLPCGSSGREAPEFLFSANAGEPPRPLRRVASGGEMSRVFLALRGVLRRAAPGSLLVFDEVDAGVGGRVADRVGRLLADLAASNQVLCITHLPQIAARGEVHLRVSKAEAGRRVATQVERLEGDEERVEELARMAAGETVAEATRRHARALLRQARAESD